MRQPGAAIGDHEAGPVARDLRLQELLTVRVVGAPPAAGFVRERR
jgi:hypothetical protein